MRFRATRAPADRASGDRGAVIIESALALPVLMLLIFGIMEAGMFLRSYTSTTNAARAAGRAGSIIGSDSTADQQLLVRLAQEIGPVAGEIEYIVVWHASGPGAGPPAACLPAVRSTPNTNSVGQRIATGPGSCNVYHRPNVVGGAFDMAYGTAPQPDPAYYFGCQGPTDPAAAHKVDCNWPTNVRKDTKTPRGGFTPPGQDRSTAYLGVYIRTRHESLTRLFGAGTTITEQSISLIEPRGYTNP